MKRRVLLAGVYEYYGSHGATSLLPVTDAKAVPLLTAPYERRTYFVTNYTQNYPEEAQRHEHEPLSLDEMGDVIAHTCSKSEVYVHEALADKIRPESEAIDILLLWNRYVNREHRFLEPYNPVLFSDDPNLDFYGYYYSAVMKKHRNFVYEVPTYYSFK
jgi:hypothetical protein